jgi:hypothetical protein
MRLNFKVALVATAAVLLLGGSSMMTALAVTGGAQQSIALDLAGYKLTPEQRVANYSVDDSGTPTGTPTPFDTAVGAYGDEVMLQPTVMTAIELPNDVFHFQVLVNDVDASGTPLPAPVWKDLSGELDIKLEDTNTVPAISYRIGVDDVVALGDGSLSVPVFPYQIRCEYKPGGASTTIGSGLSPFAGSASYSETETVDLIRNTSTKVTFSTSGSIKHAGTTFNFQVSPNCGVGVIKVTVSKSGSKTLTYNLTTDADGHASAKLKLGTKNGTYKVSAKFLGNVYGVASKTASKNVRAAH